MPFIGVYFGFYWISLELEDVRDEKWGNKCAIIGVVGQLSVLLRHPAANNKYRHDCGCMIQLSLI